MDIVKIKDIGSQILMYKGQKHSKVKFKETSKTPERYYWTVNSNLPVGETFSTDKVYVFTGPTTRDYNTIPSNWQIATYS